MTLFSSAVNEDHYYLEITMIDHCSILPDGRYTLNGQVHLHVVQRNMKLRLEDEDVLFRISSVKREGNIWRIRFIHGEKSHEGVLEIKGAS